MKKIILILIFNLCLLSPSWADITTGLVAWYKLDEGSGTTQNDSSGNANTASSTASPTYIAGKVGPYSLKFNPGANVPQYVTIPNQTNINFAFNQDFTISIWALISSSQNQTSSDNTLVEKWDTTFAGGYPYVIRFETSSLSPPSNRVYIARYDGTHIPVAIATVSTNDGIWHMYTFTKVGSTLTLYLDGISNVTTTDTTTSFSSTSNLYLGARGTALNDAQDCSLTGSLDEFRIYNRGLSANDVLQLYYYPPSIVQGGSIIRGGSVIN